MADGCAACDGPVRLLCQSPDRNLRRRAQRFDYSRCDRCGLVALVDPPEDLAAFYGDDYYRQPPLDELRRVAERERYQVEMVRRHAAPGRLVEIGSAWGVFALQARDAGFDVTALEMDETCCGYLRTVVGVDARCTDRPQDVLPELQPVDVVALWQVLEHLPAPWAVLDAASAALVPGGLLVVATPNPGSLGFRLMRSRWPHLDAPRHLWLLPLAVVERRVAQQGLELVEASFDDRGARSWNRFAWQRLLMNEVRSRTAQRTAFVLGALLSMVAAPFERGARASSYTAVFRKVAP